MIETSGGAVPKTGRGTHTRNPEIYGWLNGLSVVPAAASLVSAGCCAVLLSTDDFVSIAKLVDADRRLRPGYVCATLRMLSYLGWFRVGGRDHETSFALTRIGRIALELVSRNPDIFSVVAGSLQHAVHYRALLEGHADPTQVVTLLRDIAERVRSRWFPDPGGQPEEAKIVAAQLRTLLDGVILCPVLAALGIPATAHADGNPASDRRSTLESLRDGSGEIRLDQLHPPRSPDLLAAMLELLMLTGIFERSGDACYRPTRTGASILTEVGNFGVPVSYCRAFQAFDGGLRDVLAQKEIEEDRHVDRAMNIWGSACTTELVRLRERIGPEILKCLFDDLPLREQPAGIADMGAGSGLPLVEMAKFVVEQTRRGSCLDRYPLHLVGADPSAEARAEMQSCFAGWERPPGVRCFVVDAKVEAPEEFASRIEALGVSVGMADGATRPVSAADFLHTQMFLLHDRSLRSVDEAAASEALRAAVADLDPRVLDDVFAPDSDDGFSPPGGRYCVTDVGACADQFTTCLSFNGELLPAYVAASDLVQLAERWRPLLRYGLVLMEPHVPEPRTSVLAAPDRSFVAETMIDPAPVVWGMHFLSNQFLMPQFEHELCMLLARLVPVRRFGNGSRSVTLSWLVPAESIYHAESRGLERLI